MTCALDFLDRYHKEGDQFLERIVTEDETWVSHITQSLNVSQWHGVTQIHQSESRPSGQSQHARLWQPSFGIDMGSYLLDGNQTHPPYSPDFSPSDFHLFRYLKEFLGGKRFDTADEVKEEVQDWLSSQAADVYNLGIQKLVERYDKCLNKYGKMEGQTEERARSPPPTKLSSPTTEALETAILKVYLNSGSCVIVKFAVDTLVKTVVQAVSSQIACGTRVFESLYGIRLAHTLSDDVYWIHGESIVLQVVKKYQALLSIDEWRYELRVRYLPSDLRELYEKDKITFHYFYEQVKNDYLKLKCNVDQELALQLCCIEIRRFFKDLSHIALDKKSNFEYLERDVGLHKFLPAAVITAHKPKALRKLMQSHMKKFVSLSEVDCMFKFLRLVHPVLLYDREIFKCALGGGWSVPIELVIGPDLGISYLTDRATQPTHMASFQQVQSLHTVQSEYESGCKAILQLKISGASEMLSISCPTLAVAESMADLIDGYCRLVHKTQTSFWNKRNDRCASLNSPLNDVPDDNAGKKEIVFRGDSSDLIDDEGDYSTPVGE
ncbi:hypothetical protein TNCV_453431 [Trichonephila clavipes]|nr:hypothetical protein TNCV_453431 [Trichonephila clavipes]